MFLVDLNLPITYHTPMTLKEYLDAKGTVYKWFAFQIGMKYATFFKFLKTNSSISEDHAKRIESLTYGDWKAVRNVKGNRWSVEIND